MTTTGHKVDGYGWSPICNPEVAFHDDKRQNGRFKALLYKAKENCMNKKRAAGLIGNVEKVEVVIVVST